MAIKSYETKLNAHINDGDAYLIVYGLLQSMYVQQDAVTNIRKVLNSPEFDKGKLNRLNFITEIRNDSIGHPTKRDHKNIKDHRSNFLHRYSMGTKSFTLHRSHFSPSLEDEIIKVNVTDLIAEQREILTGFLQKIVSSFKDRVNKHRGRFKDKKLGDIFPNSLNYSFSKILEAERGGFFEFAKINYEEVASCASQYRGVDGGEGKEEFGGKDVNDVLNLLNISKRYPFSDKNNTFMIGASRGGMMTYLALKQGANVNAAVSLYAPSDLLLWAKNRPKMEKYAFNQLIPNIDTHREYVLKNRSALFWANKVNKPLLLLHGSKDTRVSHVHSTLLEHKLKKIGKTVRLKIYPGERHGLRGVVKDVLEETHLWLKLYKH